MTRQMGWRFLKCEGHEENRPPSVWLAAHVGLAPHDRARIVIPARRARDGVVPCWDRIGSATRTAAILLSYWAISMPGAGPSSIAGSRPGCAMPNSCCTSGRNEPFPRACRCYALTIFSAADRLTCSASRCREASSSARRRITCRWSWTSALSNISGLGCQQRPMTVLVHQRGSILPWYRLIGSAAR